MPKNTAPDRLSTVNGGGRRWATLKQTAAHLGVCDRTVRLMAADGRLMPYYLGPRIVRYDLNEVDAAMRPNAAEHKEAWLRERAARKQAVADALDTLDDEAGA